MNSTVVLAIVEPLAGILMAAGVLTALPAIFKSAWMRSAQGYFFRKMPVFLRWVLMGLLFCGLYAMARPLRDLVVSPFLPDKMQGVPTAKDEFDELKWMLTILAGFAVITSIAQVATAWFSALTYAKQAEAKLKEIELQQTTKLRELELQQKARIDELELQAKKSSGEAKLSLEVIAQQGKVAKGEADQRLTEINKVLESVKARYPLFYEVEEKRNEAHDALIAALCKVFKVPAGAADPTEALNYMKDIYHELDVETRQLVLSVESFASVDLHPPSKGGVVSNLKLFAVFYHAKYRYEQVLRGTVSLSDLERAEGYLLLAMRKAKRDFTLHNELGNVYLTIGESIGRVRPEGYPNFIEKAKDSFHASLKLSDTQQRANYNLAYILAKHEKRYDDAVDLLKTAKKHPNWQRECAPVDLAAYIDYNQGCYLAQSIAARHATAGVVTKAVAKEAIDCLRSGLGTKKILVKDIDADYDTDGDIWALYQKADGELQVELDELRKISH